MFFQLWLQFYINVRKHPEKFSSKTNQITLQKRTFEVTPKGAMKKDELEQGAH